MYYGLFDLWLLPIVLNIVCVCLPSITRKKTSCTRLQIFLWTQPWNFFRFVLHAIEGYFWHKIFYCYIENEMEDVYIFDISRHMLLSCYLVVSWYTLHSSMFILSLHWSLMAYLYDRISCQCGSEMGQVDLHPPHHLRSKFSSTPFITRHEFDSYPLHPSTASGADGAGGKRVIRGTRIIL